MRTKLIRRGKNTWNGNAAAYAGITARSRARYFLRRELPGAEGGRLMTRVPWTLTREWTAVIPEGHPMAPFVNGHVVQRGEHEPFQFRSGALYQRRVLIWRGRWRLAETGRDGA